MPKQPRLMTEDEKQLLAIDQHRREQWKRRRRYQRWIVAQLLYGLGLTAMAQTTAAQPQEIYGKDGAPMVLVPAGAFLMGSHEKGDKNARPVHFVFLDAFYMDTYEVTVGQYAQFLNATGLKAPYHWILMNEPSRQRYPVVNVDWASADSYCRWAEKRLPTEAEWEKAARGTDGRMYPWGNDPPNLRRANYGKDSWLFLKALAPVGSHEKGKSPYGIYDMAGNVSEWTADWYEEDYYQNSPMSNPMGPRQGIRRVLRGGSFPYDPEDLRSARRDAHWHLNANETTGFRCAKTVGTGAQSVSH